MSRRWVQEHEQDHYVQQARQDGYRSRAVYKLAQLQERDHLFSPNMTVIDLGSAPGGWCQWIGEYLRGQVRLLAVDILPMALISGVTFIQGDFQEETIFKQVLTVLGEERANVVLSDMAPNLSGIRTVDQARSLSLAEAAGDLAMAALAPQGHFVVKLFQGEGVDAYFKWLRGHFKQVSIRKPAASRAHSREMYGVAKFFKG